ncbi:MAG: GAF domain-containing protein [Sandaracinus sp.]
MADDDRAHRTSDVPADLKEEREAFVRQFLRRGFELTEDVLSENRGLREQLSKLQDENARMRAAIASNDAIRDLIKRIDGLEAERKELLSQRQDLDETKRLSEARTSEVEQELHDLANLYIASSHLHATLSVRGVVRHMRELLQQLLGAERYAIFVLREPDRASVLVAEGIDESTVVVVGEGPIGTAIATGKSRVVDGPPQPPGSLESPLAVIPLRVRERVLGAIVVASVFEQKERWAAVDHELLDLMGAQAGIALVAARLFAGVADARALLPGIDALLSPSSASIPPASRADADPSRRGEDV